MNGLAIEAVHQAVLRRAAHLAAEARQIAVSDDPQQRLLVLCMHELLRGLLAELRRDSGHVAGEMKAARLRHTAAQAYGQRT